MKNSIRLFGLPLLTSSIFCFAALNPTAQGIIPLEQSQVIEAVKKARVYIEKYGKKKAITELHKNTTDIFMGDYKGMFFLSPLHPEMIGTNQFNYKDPTGIFVVQEEINKAKIGGGWLKGRWRKNPKTGTYQCRKIYILPMPGSYFIGSWYYYSSAQPGTCLS